MKRTFWWGVLVTAAVCAAWLVVPAGESMVRLPTGNLPMSPWTYTNLQGQAVNSAAFTNQVLIVNYWSTECPPCRTEIPALNAFYGKYHSKGLEIVGIAVDQEGAAVVAPFAKRFEMKYPVVLYEFPPVPPIAGAIPLPTTLVVNRAGRVVARFLGALSEAELEKTVTPLLAEPAPAAAAPTPGS